jgi:hypothetical protein
MSAIHATRRLSKRENIIIPEANEIVYLNEKLLRYLRICEVRQAAIYTKPSDSCAAISLLLIASEAS